MLSGSIDQSPAFHMLNESQDANIGGTRPLILEDVAQESSMNNIHVEFRHTFGQGKVAAGMRCKPAELPNQVHPSTTTNE